MKKTLLFFAITILLLSGCTTNEQPQTIDDPENKETVEEVSEDTKYEDLYTKHLYKAHYTNWRMVSVKGNIESYNLGSDEKDLLNEYDEGVNYKSLMFRQDNTFTLLNKKNNMLSGGLNGTWEILNDILTLTFEDDEIQKYKLLSLSEEKLELERIIDENAEPNLTFEQDYFSITFPAEYIEDGPGIIKPVVEGDFNTISFDFYTGSWEESENTDQLLDKMKESYKNLCTQTERCPEIIENQEVEFDDVPGLLIITKHTYPERATGYGTTNNVTYEYIFIKENSISSNKIIRITFRDMDTTEKSEEFLSEINKIIKTIKFKEPTTK